jgi:hypothetical protein
MAQGLSDGRKRPRIKTPTVFGAVMAMLWTRMGSLNALEQTKESRYWKRWLDRDIGSADTHGRVWSSIDVEMLRKMLKAVYVRMRRNKALRGTHQGLRALIVDGHEQSASYLKDCKGCLARRIGEEDKVRVQYYHRHVTAMLVCADRLVLLDCEMQKAGENEVGCAARLLERILKEYPRAFEVVLGDGLYAAGNFFKMAQDHGKDVIAVLKDDRRDLMGDAMGVFATRQPAVSQKGKNHRQTWDLEGFTSWEGFGKAVRVVRCLETQTFTRQSNGQEERITRDWVWVTTLPQAIASTETIVEFGHKRWGIENQGFNELVNAWHGDHVYKHQANAIEAFWIVLLLAYNLFHAFVDLNLKAVLRVRHTMKHWAAVMAAELYAEQEIAASMEFGP